MAKTQLPKLIITILSLLIFLLLSLHFQSAQSFHDDDNGDDQEYVLDDPITYVKSTSRSRFLTTSVKKTIKNTSCDAKTKPYVCNGVSADKGKSLLYCCKKHCRDVLGDKNNCGRCGHKCRLGERCCGGVCTNVLVNKSNCGKCGKKCARGVKCEYGYCGYA
ncbi:hypothetical protein ACJIZ3_007107 [Penstemon smallii]|uniref:Uncharacterized protein n=1 Tax=Penstemon smallii TaxID=265156 RepID=A0ABD3S9R8_9LAMI